MRIQIIYPTDYQHELSKYKSGLVPSHRLWGYIELQKRGHTVRLCPPCPKIFRWTGRFGWRVWQAAWLFRERRETDAVVAVHEVSALLPLFLKMCGLLSVPFVLINMSLLHPKQASGLRGFLWMLALRSTEQIVSLASSQLRHLERVYGLTRSSLSFTPMPVDSEFFEDLEPVPEERFCLAVGTNDGKDFELLLSALPLGERLVIVTDPYNADKVRRHRCFGSGVEIYEAVPMSTLRRLYQSAAVLIVPLVECMNGSGHTVFVEGQAMGKMVVVSGVTNMTDYVEDRVNGLSVPVGDALAMRSAIEEALNTPKQFEAMRSVARTRAENRFSVWNYGQQLEDTIQQARKDLAIRCGGGTEIMQPKRRDAHNECVS